VNDTVAVVSPVEVAVPIVGAPGVVRVAVMLFDATLVADPTALVAVTVNVYEVPIDNPLTVNGEDEPVPVSPPGDDVAV
jgi:hypothetical protein